MSQPNYHLLKSMQCPLDRKMLDYHPLDGIYVCTNASCTFSIAMEKFESIVNDLYKPKPHRHEASTDNLAGLNNLGHSIRSEDYSDVQPA